MRKGLKMPGVNDLKNSRYLDKMDVNDVVTLTIAGWVLEDVSVGDKPTSMKYVLKFVEKGFKPLVLNVVNGQRIKMLTKKDNFDEWVGEKITLFHDETVEFGGNIVGGVRVLMPQPNMPASPRPTTAQQAQYDEASDGEPPTTDADIPI